MSNGRKGEKKSAAQSPQSAVEDQDSGEQPADSGQGSGNAQWKRAVMSAGLALSIPSTLIAPIIVGIFLDGRFQTGRLFFIIFGFLGLLGAAVEVFQLWKRFGQSD